MADPAFYKMEIIAFWDVTPWILIDIHWRSGEVRYNQKHVKMQWIGVVGV
jgi:hypothetical protein